MKTILIKLCFFAAKILGWLKIPRGTFLWKVNGVILRNLKTNFIVRHGLSVYLDKKDSLCLSLTEHEPGTIKIFKSYIKPGDTVLDIGANIGYLTLLAAKQTGLGGKVYAFEPETENFRLLRKNTEVNGCSNVIAVNKAVADKDGPLKLYINPTFAPGHKTGTGEGGVEIEGIALDNFIKEKVDFIKIDIEGGEYTALRGMEQILSKNPSVKMILEYKKNPGLISFLLKHKFDFYEIGKDGFTPISAASLINLESKIDLFCTRQKD